MTVHNQNRLLVEDLARDLGLEGLEFDAEGKIVLEVGEIVLTLAARPEQPSLILHAELMADPGADPSSMRAALEGNFIWQDSRGATLAIDPSSGALVIHQEVATNDLSFDRFIERLEAFAATAGAWREHLSTPAEERTAEPTPRRQPNSLGAIRA